MITLRAPRSVLASVALVALTVSLTACGASSPAPAEPATPEPSSAAETPPPDDSTPPAPARSLADLDPCELLTQEDASALAGLQMDPGMLSGTGEDRRCMYTAPVEGPLGQVEAFFGPGALKHLDIDRSLDHAFTPVEGLGDEAHLEDFAIFFRDGDDWFGVSLVRLEDPRGYDEALIAAAHTVLSRA